jgi:hypothetical protein
MGHEQMAKCMIPPVGPLIMSEPLGSWHGRGRRRTLIRAGLTQILLLSASPTEMHRRCLTEGNGTRETPFGAAANTSGI